MRALWTSSDMSCAGGGAGASTSCRHIPHPTPYTPRTPHLELHAQRVAVHLDLVPPLLHAHLQLRLAILQREHLRARAEAARTDVGRRNSRVNGVDERAGGAAHNALD
eukprot:355822-Chlamydomonas_euryale.AAC.3